MRVTKSITWNVEPSLASSTRTLTGFVTAITFANVIQELFTPFGTQRVLPLGSPHWTIWVWAIITLVYGLRFFYGNLRYIDCTFPVPRVVETSDGTALLPVDPSEGTAAGGSQREPRVTVVRRGLDLSVIIIESIVIAVAGLYLSRPEDYMKVMVALFLVELAWILTSRVIDALDDNDQHSTRADKTRAALSDAAVILSAIAIIVAVFAVRKSGAEVVTAVGAAVLFVSSIVDLAVNGRHYFS